MRSAITKIAILRQVKFPNILPGPPQETRPIKPSSVGFIPMPIDRLHHADPGEYHRSAVLRRLSDAMRGGLNLFHSVF
jgi:hypothetical protein